MPSTVLWEPRERLLLSLVKITRPFFLGAYEVTQAQYERVMGKNPSRFKKDSGGGPDQGE